MATQSSRWYVDVEPDIAYVRPRGTATFDCDVIDYHEGIREYIWAVAPPISDSRVTYDNNCKTIHISNLSTSENNTVVTCHVIPESGGHIRMSGIIEMVEELDLDGDGDGEDEDTDSNREDRRPHPKITTKPTTIPGNDVLTQRVISDNGSFPEVTTSSPSVIRTGGRINPRVTKAGEMSQDDSDLPDIFNPATIGVLVGIGVLILLAIVFVIIQRHNKNRKRQKLQTSRRRHDGYEVAPMPPMAPTIDSRYSQDAFLAVHGKLYNPKYQRPVNKDHKSVPSVAYSRDSGCVDEYVYMEPGEQLGQSLGSLSVPFGDGYDRLARSRPELDKISYATPTTSPSKKYAQLAPVTSPTFNDYENQVITGMHTFELDEQKRLKYASLSHPDQTGLHPPRRKTSYASIRGIIRILRTQNSTRVNIVPH